MVTNLGPGIELVSDRNAKVSSIKAIAEHIPLGCMMMLEEADVKI